MSIASLGRTVVLVGLLSMALIVPEFVPGAARADAQGASSKVLYAKPASHSKKCTKLKPCSLRVAIRKARSGSVIKLRSGDYGRVVLKGGKHLRHVKKNVVVRPATKKATPVFTRLDSSVPHATWRGITVTRSWVLRTKGVGSKIVRSKLPARVPAVKFPVRAPASSTSTASKAVGPVSYPSLAAARAALHTPADANYVVWKKSWPDDLDLESVFASLSPNDILVLPERAKPYLVDSSNGFMARNVKQLNTPRGVIRVKGDDHVRTWFAMARARRGILGLGPGARIEMTKSSFTRPRQSYPTDGFTYTRSSDGGVVPVLGAAEKVIEAYGSPDKSVYFGNFTMKGRDLGGVAYSALMVQARPHSFTVAENLDLDGAWRGFDGRPNGETGALAINQGRYLVRNISAVGRDESGKRVGSSPIMFNSVMEGGVMENVNALSAREGMPTYWRFGGRHVIRNLRSEFNPGFGLNLEEAGPDAEIVLTGGTLWNNQWNRGGKPAPADVARYEYWGRHLGVRSTKGYSAKITLRGVDIDRGEKPGALNVAFYRTSTEAPNVQKASDIRAFDKNGRKIPIKVWR